MSRRDQARDESFYAGALRAARRRRLARARALTGLDDELALLRLLTYELLAQQEQQEQHDARAWKPLLEALGLLIRAAGTAARLESAEDAAARLDAFADAFAATLAEADAGEE